MPRRPSASPPNPAKRRRPAEVRALLLESAEREFAESGFAVATKKAIAERAGVALSVLDRHFASKATLFSEAMLEPFAELLEAMRTDWLRQRAEPLTDTSLMQVFLGDMLSSFTAHAEAVRSLASARAELDDEIVGRLQAAVGDLISQLRLMAEAEADQREWFSADGLDLTLRFLMAMVLGTTAFDWVLLPEDRPEDDALLEEMSKVALWGLARRPS